MTEATGCDPLILTLALDETSFAVFDELRKRHFPPERNFLSAHVTLFHKLPGEALAEISATLRMVAARTEPLTLRVSGVRFLGYGSAFEIESAALNALRSALAQGWSGWLSPQDAQRWRPHVTVQNKVPAPEAKALYAELSAGFRPFAATGTGLALWHYRGGPWQAAGTFGFDDPNDRRPPAS